MKYQRETRKRSTALVIAVCLIGFGVMSNWYLVQVQPLEAPNPRLRQGFGGQAYQQLYDELLRPSVQVSTLSGTGSGVVINLECIDHVNAPATRSLDSIFILTAAHVVGNEASVKVTFFYPNNNSTTITGAVVATDTLKDLALIKAYTYATLRSSSLRSTSKPYPYVAKLAPKDYTPYIFTPVWVVGCSLGLPPRPTEGIITTLSDLSASVVNFWGINAPIWPGNSGGGVFLQETNELIGIAVLVKVYGGQLVSTMGSIVTLQDIYEFLSTVPNFLGPSGQGKLTRCPKTKEHWGSLSDHKIAPRSGPVITRDLSDCNSLRSNSH